jgi:hypothetical protein
LPPQEANAANVANVNGQVIRLIMNEVSAILRPRGSGATPWAYICSSSFPRVSGTQRRTMTTEAAAAKA